MRSDRVFTLIVSLSTMITAFLFCSAVLAHCDFNSDGYGDLAIGVPGESINGLSTQPSCFPIKYLNRPNVLGDALQDAGFGQVVACGDFNGDGLDDLAISASGVGG